MKTEFFPLLDCGGEPIWGAVPPSRAQDFSDLAWLSEHPDFAGLIRVPTFEESINTGFFGDRLALVEVKEIRSGGDRLLKRVGYGVGARVFLILGGVQDASQVAEKLKELNSSPGGLRRVVYLPDQLDLVGTRFDLGAEHREVLA